MDLVLRVASHFLVGGFIPDKFFKAKTAELKKLMLTPAGMPDVTSFEIHDRVIPFYKKFEQELLEFGVHRFAEESIRSRFETMRGMAEKIAEGAAGFHKATNQFPPRGPKTEVLTSLEMAVRGAYGEKVKYLGHAFKTQWFIDGGQLEALADRLLKKATPAELGALESASNDDFRSSVLDLKYGFLKRVNAEAAALKLVKKTKITWDPFQRIEILRAALEANYSDKADMAPTEFDLFGMKIVVNDQSVDQDQVNKYVGYLKEAYARLKAKGFAKVWYGTVLIDCQQCGGVNYNDGGEVGGHYNIGKDWVKIFERPGPFIVKLMAHELGHRHWFKGMSSEQRARFNSLVRTHEGRNPKKAEAKLIPLSTVVKRRSTLDEVLNPLAKALDQALKDAEAQRFDKEKARELRSFVRGDAQALSRLYQLGSNMVERNGDLYQSRESLQLGTEFSKLLMDVDAELVDKLNEILNTSLDFNESIEFWAGHFLTQTKKLHELGEQYLMATMKGHNETAKIEAEKAKTEIDTAWGADPRQVMPVSDYGSSNIDEAFAEVFMKYVMGDDMNRDQLESFKSVFASTEEYDDHDFDD